MSDRWFFWSDVGGQGRHQDSESKYKWMISLSLTILNKTWHMAKFRLQRK